MTFVKDFAYEIIIFLIYFINALAILNLIFREKRSTEATFAWIFILISVPALGCLLYLLVGRGVSKNNMFKIKEREDKILKNNVLDTEMKLLTSSHINPLIYEYQDMIQALANSNNAHFTTNNKVDIYPESKDFFNNLINDLKNATGYINIQFYIFKPDNIGNEILDILIERAKSGVEVRLLYDAVGSRLLTDNILLKLKNSNIKTGAFFPAFLKLINFNLNYRNHRKIVVIDGNIGYIGGNNVGDEYLGRSKKFGYWRDTHLKLTGDSVRDLNLRFLLDWRYTTNEDIDITKLLNFSTNSFTTCSPNSYKNVGAQIVSSGPDITELDEIKYGYIKMIQNAKKYIYIQSPYFILDKTLLEILKITCLSGIDVRIMIPKKPDHPFVYWASSSYAGELLKYGAKLYNYDKNAFLHAKTVVADDKICSIGTANMDIRSFGLNFEINAFMYSSEVAIKQREIFEEDMLKSEEITLDMYNSRLTHIRIKESISRLLSPIL